MHLTLVKELPSELSCQYLPREVLFNILPDSGLPEFLLLLLLPALGKLFVDIMYRSQVALVVKFALCGLQKIIDFGDDSDEPRPQGNLNEWRQCARTLNQLQCKLSECSI